MKKPPYGGFFMCGKKAVARQPGLPRRVGNGIGIRIGQRAVGPRAVSG